MARPPLVAALLGLALLPPAAPAQPAVQLNGMLGTRAALLLIDGEPRTLQVGASSGGVKLVALEAGRAVVEAGGRRQTLVLGAAPARVLAAGAPPASQITLPAGPGGHFTAPGAINGHATTFLVDTGATTLAIGQAEADKLGLRYRDGQRVVAHTANGAVPASRIMLASVRVGAVEVRDVEAVVVPAALGHVLLGNSFLGRFQMRRDNDVMTLELRR
ncbi:MAG: retropepsin-like aspartic protease [Roseateles sp.]|uniref:retropepsin-like aspartic protease family protein n=1 Tax=Roseateles sp. TaxID=1971397 RepID=UPI0039E7421D